MSGDIVARRHAVVQLQIHEQPGLLNPRDKGSYAWGHKIYEYGVSGGYFVAALPDGGMLAFDAMPLITEGLKLGGFKVKEPTAPAIGEPGVLGELMAAIHLYSEHDQDLQTVDRGLAMSTIVRIALDALAELQRRDEEREV